MIKFSNPIGAQPMRVFFVTLFLFISTVLFAGTVVEEVVARVGNEIITKSEYEQESQRLYAELGRHYHGDELDKMYVQQRKNLLEFLIGQKLLDQKARELDINTDEEVTAAIKKLKEENNIPDDQALETALEKEGTSMAQLRDDFHKRVVQQKVLWNYVQGKVNISEDEIKNYYEQHKSEMVSERTTKLIRYLIASDTDSKDKLKTEADSVLQDLKAGKELKTGDYPHLNVDGPTEFAEADLDPGFVKVINATAVHSFSDLIEAASGWAILKVDDRAEPKTITFEEARGKIYNVLLQQRAEKYQKNFMDDLRKQSYVVINPKYS
jgi:peptidyl-prolyl cis-trans isomerase SurA